MEIQKEFKRICPQCHKEIFYKDKYSFNKSNISNKICAFCSRRNIGMKNKGRKRTEEFKVLLSKKIKNHPSIKNNQERANKIRNKLLGRDVSSFHRGKLSFLKTCVKCNKEFECQPHRKESNHFCGRKCQKEYYFLNKIWKPKFNPLACDLIEEYGFKNGYNFQHALNGGEYRIKHLNYWVDGYDKEKNTVIEYNEKHHNYGSQKEKDKSRRESIIQTLKCEFIILYYDNKIEKYKYEK
jgi:hypothetical protein